MSMSVEHLVASHSAAVQRTFESLRALVHEAVPGMSERVYPGWHALGFRDAEAGYVCGVFPFEDRVHLLFEHGARLADPDGLLEGDNLKQVRYVVVRPGQRLRKAALRRLLQAALHHGRLRRTVGGAPTRTRHPAAVRFHDPIPPRGADAA